MTEWAAILASLTPAEVRAEADALYKQAARLRRMAEAMESPDTPTPAAAASLRADPSARKRSGSRSRRSPGEAKQAPTNRRPAILAVLRSEPNKAWSPKEIFDAMVECGDVDADGPVENIRVAIHRMAKTGELRKLGDGAYAAPLPDGAYAEPPPERPNIFGTRPEERP